MAKKKATEPEQKPKGKEKTLAERLAGLDAICEGAMEGDMALAGRISKNPEIEKRLTVQYITTPSDDVNMLVGGGLPRGKMTIVSGMPDSGKTSYLLETIGKNMIKDPNMISVWIESENSIDKEAVVNLHKIDPNRFYFIAQSKKQSAEGIGDLLTNLLSSDLNPDIIVINSLKMLVPKSETERSLTKQSIAEQARFNSRLMNKLIPLLAESNCALAIVQALSTAMNTYGATEQLTGGLMIRYAASMIWEFRKNSINDSDPIGKEEGMKINVFCRKNHCLTDRYPYGNVHYFVEYGKGVEQTLSTLQILIDKGVLTRRGAWIYLLDENGEKQDGWSWGSRSAFKQEMENDPEKFEQLKQMITVDDMIKPMSEEDINSIESEEKLIEKAISDLGIESE